MRAVVLLALLSLCACNARGPVEVEIFGNTMGTLEDLKKVVEHVGAGRMSPVIDSRFPLAEIGEAHRRLAERAVFGKVVISL